MTQTAKSIFMDAVELPSNEREAFVGTACAGDTSLERRVAALLSAHTDASQLLGDHTPPPATPIAGDLKAGDHVRSFHLLKEIGVGGFGTVWLAEQERPFQRLVALKVLKIGIDTKEVIARFEAERQALALMEHTGIAKVFDAGTTDFGRPFFAMELVDGPPITEYCEQNSLGTRERVRIAQKVCAALKHAHQKGVIHRDIKPNNVLVMEQDGEPFPKIIDFGIAKAIGGRLAEATIMTRRDQIIGTPGYMSPEQVEESLDVDTRSDIYSVGALLYELLTGSQPLDVSTAGFASIQRTIASEIPIRPSIRIKSKTNSHRIPHGEVRGDLDWIVMRCLEKDRDRRYDSMGLLAADLQHFLDGEVVSAGPPTLRYRVHKFARSYWRGLLVAAAMAGLLITGVVVSTNQAHKARVAEAEARLELVRAGAVAEFLQELLMGIDPALAKGRDTAILEEVLDKATAGVEAASRGIPDVEATLRNILGQAHYSIGRIPEARQQLQLALAIHEELVGHDHLDHYLASARLGPILADAGEYETATTLLRHAYAGLSQELGTRNHETRLARSNLAATLQAQELYEESEPLLRQIEADSISEFGPEHAESLRAQNNLGTLLAKLGHTQEAKRRFEFVSEVQIRTLTLEHPQTMATLNNLAGIYQELEQNEDAERLYRQLLEAKIRLLPPGHPGRLIGQNNLAHFLAAHDHPEEAAEIRAAAIASSKKHHGLANRYTLTLLVGEGMAQLEAEEYELAEKAFLPVVAEAPGVFGPGGSLELTAMSNLAEALLQTERPQEALETMQPVMQHIPDAFPDSPDVHAAFRARYGLILHAVGKDEEALVALRRAQGEFPGLGLDRWEARVADALAEISAQNE